ncbi:MAG: restriction endonuclease subunit S [Spongiibacteraceae bacterium]
MSNAIPNGWELTNIGNIGKVVTGSTPSTQEPAYWGGGVPFVSPADFNGAVYVKNTQRNLTRLGATKARLLPRDAVLVTCIGSLGGIAMSPDECVTNQQINAIVPNVGNDARYCFYNVLFNIDELAKNAGTTTLPIINKSTFELINLLRPPLPEQQKIASILTAVDDVIESTQAQINKLKDLKTGMMQELLTKGIGHTEFKDSPVGRIPKAWNIVKMDDICRQITDGEHQTPRRTESGYYLLSARNIRDGFIALSDVDFIPEDEYNRISKRVMPEAGDILVSCSGSIGRTAVVPAGLKFSMVRSVAILKPNHDVVDSQFLAFQISSTFVQVQIERTLSQLAQANLFQAPIKALNIVLPSLSEQRSISKTVLSVDKKIQRLERKLSQSQQIKKALMQDLLTGKVRVKVN